MESEIAIAALALTTAFSVYMWQKSARNLTEESKNAIEATINLENKNALLEEITKERDKFLLELKAENQLRINAETEVKLAQQENESIAKQMENWEKTKKEHQNAVEATLLETTSKMSSKLLEDHKRASEEAKKESEDNVKKTTEDLHKNFKNVFESVNTLNEQVQANTNKVDTIHGALLSPSGAGNLAEITLENIFKASGLIEGQDYEMQYWVGNSDGGGLKPDAVIYLPFNNILVVDSKASKFFMEIGEADSDSEVKIAEGKLKITANNHLKDLIKRGYKEAIEEQMKKRGRAAGGNIEVMMFLPTEDSLQTIRKIDKQFEEKAWKEHIFPVGPTGLINRLLTAGLSISNVKQEQNAQKIADEVKNLIGSIATFQGHALSMGKSLKSSSNKYNKFVGSFNGNFLSKINNLEKLGISPPKNKKIDRLETYQLISESNLIEGESDELLEVGNVKQLEDTS